MKTVLITGASRGIGKATAIEFAKKGYAVAVNYNKSKSEAEKLCREITALGGKAKAFSADISKADSVKKMVKDVLEHFGKIDVLINNAGVALNQGLFTDFTEEDIEKVFKTNVFGMMNVTKEVIPEFIKKKSGKIVNVSSVWGVLGASCEVIYSSSKGAVIAFTKALARELAPSGVCVNCIAPGMIDTDMNSHLSEADKKAFSEEIPLYRIGKADEVAKAVYFLASEDADYITGKVMEVDGGLI